MRTLLILLLLSLGGCAKVNDRQACYAESEASFVAQGYAACQAKGVAWKDCSERPRLIAELTAKQKGCP